MIPYQEHTIDLSKPFAAMTLVVAIAQFSNLTKATLIDEARARAIAADRGIQMNHGGHGRV